MVEVRDARLPVATAHGQIADWCAGKPRVLVLTHADAVPAAAAKAWQRSLRLLSSNNGGGGNGGDASGVLSRHVQNQATQAAAERAKYSVVSSSSSRSSGSTAMTPATARTGASLFEDVLFVNAKAGAGVFGLTRCIVAAGAHVQERRAVRGLLGRPLRVGILGYPNVGKSALINRLVGRKRCLTKNLPGVTRSLQWIRINSSNNGSNNSANAQFELLDSPGVLPARLENQSDALLLAACHCIGEAAYDNQAVAAHLCQYLIHMHEYSPHFQLLAPAWRQKCVERYNLDPLQPPAIKVSFVSSDAALVDSSDSGSGATSMTGEDILFGVADNTCQGDPEDAARKILQDFRTGRMGPICLQVAPSMTDGAVAAAPSLRRDEFVDAFSPRALRAQQLQQERQERAALALETAKVRGLALPSSRDDSSSNVGKGQFDGW